MADKKKRKEEEVYKANRVRGNVRVKEEEQQPVRRNYGVKPLHERIDEKRDVSDRMGMAYRQDRRQFVKDAMAMGAQAAADEQQKRRQTQINDEAIEMIRSGKVRFGMPDELPYMDQSGYGFKRAGNTAVYATPTNQLPDVEKTKTATRAQAPGAFGILPSQYADAMQAIDERSAFEKKQEPADVMAGGLDNQAAREFVEKWFPEKGGKIPTSEEVIEKYKSLQPYQQDELWMNWQTYAPLLEEYVQQADEEKAAYEQENERTKAGYDSAVGLLGEDAPKQAGKGAGQYYDAYKNNYRTEKVDSSDPYQLGGPLNVSQEQLENWFANPLSKTTQEERGDLQRWGQMSPQERETYDLIESVYGEEEAQRYLEDMRSGLNQRVTENETQKAAEFAKRHPIVASLAAPVERMQGAANFVEMAAQELISGEEQDPYDLRRLNTRNADTIVGTVGQQIENGVGGVAGKVLGFGYQTVMSLADMGANMLLLGPAGATASGAGMGFSAASSAYNDAIDRGADHETANKMAAVAGVAEMLFERFSIESLIDVAKGNGMKTAVKNVLRQMGIEASEETATEVANQIGDYVLMGDKSVMAQQGPAEVARQIALAGAGGLLMGGISGGAAQTYQSVTAKKEKPAQSEAEHPKAQEMVQDEPAEAASEAEKAQAEETPAEEESAKNEPQKAEEGNPLQAERAVTVRRNGNAQAMTVTGVEDVSNGSVFLQARNEDGDTEIVNAADAEFDDAVTQDLLAYEGVGRMDAKTVAAYMDGYDPSIATPREYAKAYESAYQDGVAGLGYERMLQVDRMASSYLTSEARLKAYAAGMKANEQKAGTTEEKTGGAVRAYSQAAYDMLTGQRKRRAQAGIELTDVLARRMKRKIRIVDEVVDENGEHLNGRYNVDTGEIEVALDADAQGYAYVAAHELVHVIKTEHADMWGDFENFVADVLNRNGQDLSELMDEQMERYGLDAEMALEEVICNTVPGALQNEENLMSLYKGNRDLFERVMDWLRAFVDDIKKAGEALVGHNKDWQQMKVFKDDSAAATEVLRRMEEILAGENKKAAASESAAEAEMKASRKAENYYDYSKPFAEQVKDLKEGRFPKKNALLISGTPEVLQKIGFSKLPLMINQDHILRMERDTEHYLSEEMIKQLPELMKDPVAVIVSESEGNADSSIVMILEAIVNGKPYVAPVYITSESRNYSARIDSNNVATVFRKGNAITKLMENALQKENADKIGVYYWKKTEAQNLFEGAGVQFPGSSIQDGLIHSIHDAGSPVKARYVEQTDTKQFKKWFNGSKIKNQDGTAKLMYRGGGEDIEIFDRKKSKASNLYGRGFYFTDSESHAKQYGEARAYYLNVKNPLDASSNAKRISEKQLRAFLEAVAEDEDYGLENYGYGATVDSVMAGLKGKNDFDVLQDINATAIGDFVAAIELFNEVNGTEYDGIITPTETVVFDSRQIKSATDNVGIFDPKNPNVKFSRKGMDDGYEETRDLLAVHNMTEENLLGALELGGIAMPSIAVIKAEQGHSKFGPISVVFDKYTIDPEESRYNEIYGADAWTPVFPQVRYEASEKTWDRISKKYYELEKKVGNQTARIMYGYVSDLDEELNRKGGVQGIVKNLEDSTDMMQMYLADNGWEKTEPEKKVVVKRTAKHLAEQYDSLIEKMGEGVMRSFEAPEGAKIGDHRRAWLDEHREKLKQAYIEVLADAVGLPEEKVAPLAEDMRNVRKMLVDAYYYLKNGGEIREEVTDYEGFNKMIRAQVDRPAYRKWLEELFKGAEKRKGIRNDKDIFTPSGNRRSFAQTHWEVTLDNVVRAMRAEEKTGVGSLGGRNIEGAAVKKYKSIADVKADKDRLKTIPEEEYEEMRKGFHDRFREIAAEYAGNKDIFDAGDVLVEYITKTQTASGIYKLMQKEAAYYKPSEYVAEDLAELVKEMVEMPTGYFEAKPRRGVGFDEAAYVIAPDDLKEETRKKLEEAGVEVIEYKSGDEADRLEKINGEKVSAYKFSRKGLDENIDEELDHVRDAFELVRHTHRINAMEADQLAGKILKEASSTFDRKQAAEEIAQIFDYVERADSVNMDHVDRMQTDLMARIMNESRVLDEEHEQLVDPIRQYLKGTYIKLSEQQRKEAENITGSYGAYRRQLFGRVKLSKNGLPLDVAWEELHEINPEWFPENTNEGDMPDMLLQVADAIKPAYETPMNVEETASWLAGRLNEAYLTLPAVKSAAKSATKLGKSVQEMRKAMTQFAQANGEEFGKALDAIEKARDSIKDEEERKALREIRRQYNEWKQQDADKREERFQLELKREKEKLKANDIAMRSVYAKVIAEGYKRQRMKDNAERRERELLNKQRARLEATVRTLTNWLEKPTDAKHVPAGLNEPLRELLVALDFSGKNTKVANQLSEKLNAMANALEAAQEGEDESRMFFLERDQQMVDEIRRVAQLIKGNTTGRGVYDLNGMELKDVNKWMGVIKHVLVNASKMRGSDLGDVQQVAAESILEISRKKPMKDKKWIEKRWEKYFGVDMMDAFTFFERLGPTSNEVFMGLRRGFDKTVQLIRGAQTYTEELLKDVDVKKLSGEKAEKLEVEVRGRTVTMTRANIMELYVLNKRAQAKGHIYKGGFRIKGDEDAHALLVEKEDVAKITGLLTDEERRIADGLQEYLSKECAEWGNETSMRLLGYKKFGEENYWPIKTDSNERNTTKLEENFAANISAIKNQGMTKQLIEGASNAIVVGDIFDTYTQHISNMSAYAGYAIPLSDMQKWLNSRGLKTEIEHVMGAKGKQYISNFLMALNGTAASAQSTELEKFARMMARNAKTASVGANARVIIQQPTSYARAAMYISPKHLAKALEMKAPAAEEVDNYCAIAAWKRLGFYETNIGPGLREMIVGDAGALDKARELAMKPAAAGDNWTINHLWNACVAETEELYPELDKNGEEFKTIVGKRLSEVIDRTQVVDSVFHRSQIMRSKNWLAQTLTNFMSEPNKTFNMLTSAIYDYAENRKNPAAKARVARALGTWAVTSILTAAAAGIVDAFRDDEEEKAWLEKYLDAVLGNTMDNMNPLGMLPGVKDALSIVQGYDPSRIDQQSIQKLVWAYEEVGKYLEGRSTQNMYGVIYKVAQALSSTVGVPVSNVLRDGEALVETVIGHSVNLSEKKMKSTRVMQLFDALTAGDGKKAQAARDKLRKAGMSTKEIDTAVAERLSADERIQKAWEAKKAGKIGDVNRTKNALAREGFTGEMVDKAIAEYEKTVKPKEKKAKDLDETLNVTMYTYDDAMNAIRSGASVDDVMLMMSEMAADSKAKDPEASVRSELKSRVKKDYMEAKAKNDTAAMNRNKAVLTQALGVTDEDMTAWEREQHTADLKAAVNAFNAAAAKRAVNVMRKDGKTDSQIKSSLSSYKWMYVEAMERGDAGTANRIKRLLMELGLKDKKGKPLYSEDTFREWLK